MKVILDNIDYSEEAKQRLNDTTTYRLLETDWTTKLKRESNKTMKKLQELEMKKNAEKWGLWSHMWHISTDCQRFTKKAFFSGLVSPFLGFQLTG